MARHEDNINLLYIKDDLGPFKNGQYYKAYWLTEKFYLLDVDGRIYQLPHSAFKTYSQIRDEKIDSILAFNEH